MNDPKTTSKRARTATVRELGSAALELVDVLAQWAAFILHDLADMARTALEKEKKQT